MTVNERVKAVRKALNMKQEDFGKKLTVALPYMSQIENGERDVTEKILKLVCLQFNVSEHWLRTGEGDMFVTTSDSMMENFCTKYNLDSISRSILEIFIELPPEYRHAILDAAKKLVQRTSSKEELDIDADIKATKSDTNSQHQNETRA